MSIPKSLSTLTRVPLREAWKHEAGEFTPWLAQPENLERLADELGLNELACVATEHRIGDFKLDMLCNDGTDHVIVENQLEETDHKHLGQLLPTRPESARRRSSGSRTRSAKSTSPPSDS